MSDRLHKRARPDAASECCKLVSQNRPSPPPPPDAAASDTLQFKQREILVPNDDDTGYEVVEIDIPCYRKEGFEHTRLAATTEEFDAARRLLSSVFRGEDRQKAVELVKTERAEALAGSQANERWQSQVVLRFDPDNPGPEPVAAAVYCTVHEEKKSCIRVHYISTKCDIRATRTKSSVQLRHRGHATKLLEFIQHLHPALGWSVIVANEPAAVGFWRKNGLDFAGGSMKAAMKKGWQGSMLMVGNRLVTMKHWGCNEEEEER
jgi:hypothetical protein